MTGPAARQRRAGPLLLLVALVAGAAAFQYLGRGASGEPAPFRFVMQAEPRPLPALTFVDGSGKPVDLAQWRGKVVLLNIWATWCAPCRREMPSLDRLQAALGGEAFDVVALSIDQGPRGLALVQAFYAELGLRHLRVYHDAQGQSGFELGVPGVPATFLVDPAGREIGRLVGPAEWDGAEAQSLIRRHLGRAAPP